MISWSVVSFRFHAKGSYRPERMVLDSIKRNVGYGAICKEMSLLSLYALSSISDVIRIRCLIPLQSY